MQDRYIVEPDTRLLGQLIVVQICIWSTNDLLKEYDTQMLLQLVSDIPTQNKFEISVDSESCEGIAG